MQVEQAVLDRPEIGSTRYQDHSVITSFSGISQAGWQKYHFLPFSSDNKYITSSNFQENGQQNLMTE